MKEWIWFLGIFSLLFFTHCKKEHNLPKTTKNQNNILPKFDSLDWEKAYNFQKASLTEREDKYNQINQFYNDYWLYNKVSGGFLIAQHGEVIYEAYSGYSDFETETPITAETPIHIASISKVLTGLAILKLVEFKKINLNENVSTYLEKFPYKNVKVEDLLNHRSGLPNYLYFSDDKNYWDNTKQITNQDVLNILITKKPDAASLPGKNFSYNNTNFILLALIIEEVTGKSYPEAMDYMVFRPLGMKNTFVMEFEKDSANVSKSYYFNGKEWKFDYLDTTYGDKNIYSTPRDLFKMDIAMYSDKFLPKELKKIAWKGYSYESKGIKNYGLGIRMMEWDDGSKILYHNGWWHGNYTTYVRDFENEATIIALGNRKNRTVYSTFNLVGIFGNYPLELPEAQDSTISKDSLQQLQYEIDNTKQSDLKKHSLLQDSLTKSDGKIEAKKVKSDLKKAELPIKDSLK